MAEVVYFIQAMIPDRRIKIGYTGEIHWRVGQIRADSSMPIKLLGVIEGGRELEQELHKQFAKTRILNQHWRTEWFLPSDKLLQFIKTNTYMPKFSKKAGRRFLQLEPELTAKLEIFAYNLDMSISEVVAMALDQYFGDEWRQLPLPFID